MGIEERQRSDQRQPDQVSDFLTKPDLLRLFDDWCSLHLAGEEFSRLAYFPADEIP